VTTKVNSRTSRRLTPYQNFTGLDSSRDLFNQDDGERQALHVLENAFTDFRGQIVRFGPARYRFGDLPVRHSVHFDTDTLVVASERNDGLQLESEQGYQNDFIFPRSAILSSTVFNRNIMLTARGLAPTIFDGSKFRFTASTAATLALPAFCTTVQQRLCIAGLSASDTQVMVSAANSIETFFGDEAVDASSPLRAGNLDIANLLGTADKVTGISSFETDKLCIFTNDTAFVYKLDPDITLWELQTEASANYGAASHNTIQQAGSDLLYCSRSGIHALRRLTDNGLQITSVNLSEKIDQIYRDFFDKVTDPQQISAVWHPDEGQYHVFFPIADSGKYNHLVMTLNSGDVGPTFSTGDYLGASGGTFLGGDLVFNTKRGVYTVERTEGEEGVMPNVQVETPVLWMGGLDSVKQSKNLIIQAFGNGELTVTAVDDQSRDKWQATFMLTDEDDDGRRTVPLQRQYERPMSIRFRGLRFKFEFKGTGLFRIIGFAVELI
jgi:hypothetical protein